MGWRIVRAVAARFHTLAYPSGQAKGWGMQAPEPLGRHLLLSALTSLQKRVRALPSAGTAPFFMSTKAFDRLNERKSKVATYNLDMKLVGAWLSPGSLTDSRLVSSMSSSPAVGAWPSYGQMAGCSCLGAEPARPSACHGPETVPLVCRLATTGAGTARDGTSRV